MPAPFFFTGNQCEVFTPQGASMANQRTSSSPAFKAAGGAPSGLFGNGGSGATGMMSRPVWMGDGRHRGSDRIWANGEEINYRAKVGDITNNNAILSCLMWLMRNYPSAPVKVRSRKDKKAIPDHPLEQLLRRPTKDPLISYSTLSAGIVMSYWGHGNVYLFKVRNSLRQVVELWWRPHWMVKPIRKPGSPNFIDHYLYKPDSLTPEVEIPREDVVHLRFGFDPDNEMLGMSPLRALLKTVYTEQEANAFLASILTNLGVVGAVITHKPEYHKDDDSGEGEWSTLADEDGKAIKATYKEEFSAGKRGSVLLLDGDFEVMFPSINIDATLAEKAKKISQADIAAAFGIPPAIAGFLVGLEHQDARAAHESMLKQAYTSCLCPMQRDNAADMERQLLPDFESLTAGSGSFEVYFDYTDVPAMQESQDAMFKRWLDMFARGGCTRAEMRQALGLKSEKTRDDVFFLVKGGVLVPQDHDPTELMELMMSGGAGPPEAEDPKNDDDPPPGGKPPEKPPKPKGKET